MKKYNLPTVSLRQISKKNKSNKQKIFLPITVYQVDVEISLLSFMYNFIRIVIRWNFLGRNILLRNLLRLP